jgi:hypothetical protein
LEEHGIAKEIVQRCDHYLGQSQYKKHVKLQFIAIEKELHKCKSDNDHCEEVADDEKPKEIRERNTILSEIEGKGGFDGIMENANPPPSIIDFTNRSKVTMLLNKPDDEKEMKKFATAVKVLQLAIAKKQVLVEQ